MNSITNIVSDFAYKIKGDIRLKDSSYFETSLSGELNFDSVDLLYLILEIMCYYKIRFCAEDVSDYRFNTISEISECVRLKL